MSFTGQFIATLNPLDQTTISISDLSLGSDPNITDRQVTLFLVSGGTLVPAGTTTTYIDWPYPFPSTLVLTGILAQDVSLLISVTWISSSPIAGSIYTSTVLYTFTGNIDAFDYSLVQKAAANQSYLQDADFVSNWSKLRLYRDNAVQAQAYGSQGNAQLNINLCYDMINNSQLFF